MGASFPLLTEPREARRWYHRIPILGWFAALSAQYALERSLVDQAVERGPVPDSAWSEYRHDPSIRRKIEEIVVRHAYPKGSTFHPLDPVELMFVLRYGDLNEMEIVLAIENELGFVMDAAFLERLIADRTPFIEFLEMVENAKTQSARP